MRASRATSSLLVTECFIRAIEARTTGSAKNAEAEREQAVQNSTEQGYILTRYFYEALVKFEKDPVGLGSAYGDWSAASMCTRSRAGGEGSVRCSGRSRTAASFAPQRRQAAEYAAEQRFPPGTAESAQKLAQQALEEKSEDPGRALFILAEVATMNRDIQGARNYFQRALEVAHEPKVVAWSHIYLGRILDLQEDRESALDQYRAAVTAGSALPEAKAAAELGLQKPYEPTRPFAVKTAVIAEQNQLHFAQGESMKRAAMLVVILALAHSYRRRTQTPPAPAGTAATAPPPQGKRPPQAKTQPEFDAYKVAAAESNDGAVLEKAADDFATKYPDSELRILLYKRRDERLTQPTNNPDKMMEMGRKVLKIDPDDPEALVGVAQVLVERTRDSDMDKDQRWDEAHEAAAARSSETSTPTLSIPPNTPQDKVDAYKSVMRVDRLFCDGHNGVQPGKICRTRKAIFAKRWMPSRPSPIQWRYCGWRFALDKQGKYPEALKYANQAVQLTEAKQVPAIAGLRATSMTGWFS